MKLLKLTNNIEIKDFRIIDKKSEKFLGLREKNVILYGAQNPQSKEKAGMYC